MNDAKIKHLEMIQAVIARMAHCLFLLKGWSVTIVAALFALVATKLDARYVLIALLPALTFWGLDAFYLRQERLFRRLYDAVRLQAEEAFMADPFSMNTSPFKEKVACWCGVAFSRTVWIFHLTVVVIVIIVFMVMFYKTRGGT